MRKSLEPHIHNAPSVAAKVIKADKSVEVIHDDGTHHFRFREPQIDGNAAAAVLSGGERAPIGYAAAVRTKMKAEGPAPDIDPSGLIPVSARLRNHRPRAPRSVGRPCSCRRWPTRGFLQNSSGPRRNDKSLLSSYLHYLLGRHRPYHKRPLLAHFPRARHCTNTEEESWGSTAVLASAELTGV